MASQPPKRERLPFEPAQKRAKMPKKAPAPRSEERAPEPQIARDKANASLSAIPDAVSKRMVRRMAILCGTPTALGIASFFLFYVIVTQEWFELPASAVVLVTMGLFGLGVLGLSYGIISASWDEDQPGTLLGWEEFQLNAGRLFSAWREARRQAKGESPE